MQEILNVIEQYGLIIVLVNVFLEQIGLPIPAYPSILIAGALASSQNGSYLMLLLSALVGSLLADYFWFYMGRNFGKKVLNRLCKISLSADSSVRKTESIFLRIGPTSLLFCKFIPGFASVSSAMAGALGTGPLIFIIFDGLGAIIWAGSAIVLGTLFDSGIEEILSILVEMGKWGATIIAIAFGLFILKKWWDRYQFAKSFHMARISVESLCELICNGSNPLIIDVRPAKFSDQGWIPGARFITTDQIDEILIDVDTTKHIILYCSCPSEATAAVFAKEFHRRGYMNVHPLSGGIDAWIEAGYALHVPTALAT
jgi:membrane protein DedA with SNARE-associated domain/rhodanese-related sulfurtransferase